MNKWYVLYVKTGYEDDARHVIERDIKEVNVKVFKEEIVERRQGKNRTVIRLLYPGYVFINCSLTDRIYYGLVGAPGVIKILGTRTVDGGCPIPVPENEMLEILGYQQNEEIIKMSEAVIENGKIKILSGPLMGKERYIFKVDKRKGKVKVNTQLFGKPKSAYFGIVIKEPQI